MTHRYVTKRMILTHPLILCAEIHVARMQTKFCQIRPPGLYALPLTENSTH